MWLFFLPFVSRFRVCIIDGQGFCYLCVPTHKNPHRSKKICGMCPVGWKDRLIDLKMFFVEYPVCVISVAVLVAVVKQHLFKSLLCFTIERVYFSFSKL